MNVGIPRFIVLLFVTLPRHCGFYKTKTRPSTNKKIDSTVVLFCSGLEGNMQYLWGMSVFSCLLLAYDMVIIFLDSASALILVCLY